MGDRISIGFRNGNEESVVLFSHWEGMDMLKVVKDYITILDAEVEESFMFPMNRREPNTVMLDFIRHCFGEQKRIMSSYYLGKDSSDGDNGDNGHFWFVLETNEFIKE